MKQVLWVAVVLAIAAGEARAQAGKGGIEGKWLILYAEEGGRRENSWENRQATVAGNVLSYEGEGGKKLSLTLKVGKGQTVEATSSDGGTLKGVYILGQDYLCLSVSKGGKMKKAATGGAPVEPVPVTAGAPAPQAGEGAGHGSSGDFILILRRVRGQAKAPAAK
jgi:hypothetical protein